MKNTLKIAVAAVLSILAVSHALAGEICFDSKRGWEDAKAKLPKIMQTLPVYLGHADGTTMLTGAMQIDWSEKDRAFKIDFRGYHSFAGDQSKTGLVHEFCSNDGLVTATDIDGETQEITIIDENTVSVKDYTFKKVSDPKIFSGIVTKIRNLARPNM